MSGTTKQWFESSFDSDINEALTQSVHDRMGCYHCHVKTDNRAGGGVKLNVCSKCHFARYCGRDCQLADWRKQHREGCAAFCENRDHPANFTIAEVLKGGGMIEVAQVETYIAARRNAFFLMLKEAPEDRPPVIHLSASINWQWQRLWVAGETSFWGGDGVCRVNRVLFDVVDRGERARTLFQDQSPEKLTKAAMRKTHDVLVAFAKDVHDSNGEMASITFGRGLISQVDNEALMDRMRATGCKVTCKPVVASNHL